MNDIATKPAPLPTKARRRRLRSTASVLLLGAVLVATIGVPVGAQTEPQQGPPINQWAITPTGDPPDQPGQRTTLSYDVAPGDSIEDSVSVFNFGSTPLGFEFYATDGLNTAEGAYDLLRRDQAASDVGTWVELAQDAAIIQPGTGISIPLTVTVPVGASPGDHSGGIVASLRSYQRNEATGAQIPVDQRVGIPLYVSVQGDLDPRLAVEDLTSVYRRSALSFGGGELEVTYTVRNVGNVRLGADQVVSVKAPLGFQLDSQEPEAVPTLLPGSSVTRKVVFSGVPPALRLTTEVTLNPVVPPGSAIDPAPTPTTRSTSVWAIPWLWFVLLVALVTFIGVRVGRRRSKPNRAAPAPPPPVEVTVGAPPT